MSAHPGLAVDALTENGTCFPS